MEAKKSCSHRHIPDDIMLNNILTKFPVKSLFRSKLVSKRWRSFIEDPVFIDKIRPKTQPQWIRPSPDLDNNDAREVHIYSIDYDNGPATLVHSYLSPPGVLRQYNNLICSYNSCSQLTLFNTTTQESVVLPLPITDEAKRDFRSFEYGSDPVSKRYKVLSYGVSSFQFEPTCGIGDLIGMKYYLRSFDFKVLTLEGENPTWRRVKNLPKIRIWTYWVTVAGGALFWFNDKKPAQIISFNLATEEFTILKTPSTNVYFRRPLFEFEGSLCFVETPNLAQQGSFQLELKVWMLKDIENRNWVEIEKFNLSLEGTNLRMLENASFVSGNFSTLVDAELSAPNGELLVAAHDKKEQYVFSCNFLNGESKRMKIIGQHFQHPQVKRIADYFL